MSGVPAIVSEEVPMSVEVDLYASAMSGAALISLYMGHGHPYWGDLTGGHEIVRVAWEP